MYIATDRLAVVKRISTAAYQALRDALPSVTWYKRPFEQLLRTTLRDNPELLSPLNFADTKRAVADALVDHLMQDEDRYQTVTINLISDLAAMTSFPDIEQLEEPDRSARLATAKQSVARLKEISAQFSEHRDAAERVAAEAEIRRGQVEALQRFDDDVAALKDRFLQLRNSSDRQQRGYALERLLSDVFLLFDMEPHLAYSTDTEQIDGSLSFDTDDYVLEAKWILGPVDRAAGDVFAAKVHRKGKNALGLFVAIDGFSKPLQDAFSMSTPFITMDGTDLFLVLDGRVRLDDMLKAKRRYANETGSCYRPASSLV